MQHLSSGPQPRGAHLPPGAPSWGLSPANMPMIWQGLTDAQLCASIKDPKQNKGRNLDNWSSTSPKIDW